MPWQAILVLTLVLLVFWTIIPGFRHRRYLRAIRNRNSGEPLWLEQFGESRDVVERTLVIFCNAFLLKSAMRFQFRPDDRVMDIYKGTTGPVADEMQLERLTMDIEEEFGVDVLDTFDETTTLADLVSLSMGGKKKMASGRQ